MIDGFLFAGGEDLCPSTYGQVADPKLGVTCKERDDFELSVFDKVYKLRKPILGVCRGLQLINVALGGTLTQDIPSKYKTDLNHEIDINCWKHIAHEVDVSQDSILYKITKKAKLLVNSIHHQCIDKLADSLRVVASTSDGIIEAVENDESHFLLAVQWHPESLWQDNKELEFNLDLFKAFVSQASKKPI
jgi:putative glutamine amidotransferase